MFEVGVSETFEAAHALVGDFGPAARIHGHTYRVELVVGKSSLDKNGCLYDIAKLRIMLRELTERLHYRNLNEVPVLQTLNTTAENLCRYLHDNLVEELRVDGLEYLKVTVWENPDTFAAFSSSLKI